MTRLERIIMNAEAAAQRLERPLLAELVRHLQASERRLIRELERLYRLELAAAKDEGRVFREGRARAILAQLQAYVAPLRETPALSQDALLAALEQGYEAGVAMLAAYGAPTTFTRPTVNFDAVRLQVENSRARLFHHSDETVEKINRAVVDGLIRGRGSRVVAREIHQATGLLRSRAESIAITELGQARADAREQFYALQGVDLVQRFVTLDERTCGQCAPRHGEITERTKTVEKLHVRCRCYLAPIRRDWLELELIDLEAFADERAEILAGLRERGVPVRRGPAPFETERPDPLEV